jgi:hypothetical protein
MVEIKKAVPSESQSGNVLDAIRFEARGLRP